MLPFVVVFCRYGKLAPTVVLTSGEVEIISGAPTEMSAKRSWTLDENTFIKAAWVTKSATCAADAACVWNSNFAVYMVRRVSLTPLPLLVLRACNVVTATFLSLCSLKLSGRLGPPSRPAAAP